MSAVTKCFRFALIANKDLREISDALTILRNTNSGQRKISLDVLPMTRAIDRA